MTREQFEQLVDAWLAEPQRADLKAQIDAAVRAAPQWAALLGEWQCFDQLLRRESAVPDGIDWGRLKTRILAAMQPDADETDGLLDAALRAMPTVDDRVRWPRFHARVMAAVTRSSPISAASRRRRYTRVVAGAATLLAAAAALLLAFLPRSTPVIMPQSLVHVGVGAPLADVAGVALVRITGAPVAAAAAPERLFDIDPLPQTEPIDETAGYY